MSWGPGPMSISAPARRQALSPPPRSPNPSPLPATSALSQSHQQSGSPVRPWRRLHKSRPALKGWTPSTSPRVLAHPIHLCVSQAVLGPAPASSPSKCCRKRAQGDPHRAPAAILARACPLASQSEALRPPVSHFSPLCRKPQWPPLSSWTESGKPPLDDPKATPDLSSTCARSLISHALSADCMRQTTSKWSEPPAATTPNGETDNK